MATTRTKGLVAPKNGKASPRPRDGWISLDECRPPHPSPLLLVTNNLNASNRLGCMSHVWLAAMIHYCEGPQVYPYPLAFVAHTDRKVQGITHWRYAIPSEGEGL